MSLMLAGCFGTTYVRVPVFTPPEFTMPVRPIMLTEGVTINDVSRDIEQNMILMQEYSTQLESIIEKFKPTQTNQNNK